MRDEPTHNSGSSLMGTKKTSKAKSPAFSISLTLGDKNYTSSGTTALEALIALKHPEKIMGKGVVTLTQGDKTKTLLFYPQRLKRLFYNSKLQAIQAKQLAMLLK
jgi:hypothetical protein